jgi:glycosyltransferase involved in cell wall biosynthesis
MYKPTVSIGLPVFNGENFVKHAIESILTQDYDNLELVISDNASTDLTEDICRDFARRDGRVKYSRNKTNFGAAANYNQTFHLATGSLFKWAAHDDECMPGYLRRCVETFEGSSARVSLVYPRAELINEKGAVIGIDTDRVESRDGRPHKRLKRVLRGANKANAIFGLIRSDLLRRTRLIDRFIASDYVLLAELALLGEIWEIPDILSRRRIHPGISAKAGPIWSEIFVTSKQSREFWSQLLRWFDSSRTRYPHVFSPNMILGWEYAKSIHRLCPLSFAKVCCYATIPLFWYAQHFRNAGGIQKRKLRRFLGLKDPESRGDLSDAHLTY